MSGLNVLNKFYQYSFFEFIDFQLFNFRCHRYGFASLHIARCGSGSVADAFCGSGQGPSYLRWPPLENKWGYKRTGGEVKTTFD